MNKVSIGAKTVAVPAPVWLIGSYDNNDMPNLATVAWGGICCSAPPCINISLRKSRHSYAAIVARNSFTINIPSEDWVREADYAGLVSGKTVRKFEAMKLTPVRSQVVEAPYVAEFPMILECRVLQVTDLGVHTQFTAEIIDVRVDVQALDAQGQPNAQKIRPIAYDTGTKSYYGLGKSLGKGFIIGRELGEGVTE